MMTQSWQSPVFYSECIISARRWQTYAGRVLLVGALLAGLSLVWHRKSEDQSAVGFRELAEVGSAFTNSILAVELSLVFLLVPAITAGAVCSPKATGELALIMTTQLTNAEIVLGKLASNLVVVLGVIFCTLPVLAITFALGGVDPQAIVHGTLVIVGVAVLGVAVSLFYSVWASKPYEALMATYATWAVWLLPLLSWTELFRGSAPELLFVTNPFWLTFGYRWFGAPGRVSLAIPFLFLAGAILVSAGLVLICIHRIRSVTLRQSSRAAARRGDRRGHHSSWLTWFKLGDPSLDANPVLWLEWNRRESSVWTRAIWVISGIVASVFAFLAIFVNDSIGGGVGGFIVGLGLILVAVKATSVLAEERASGSMSILLSTPLSIRAILMGKWWGAFRMVPRLAVLPALLALGLPLQRGRWLLVVPLALAVTSQVLAYGAAVTSMGLFVAARQPRLGRALTLSVGTYLTFLLVLPAIIISCFQTHPLEIGALGFSPFMGVYAPICGATWGGDGRAPWSVLECFLWAMLSASLALFLLWRSVETFDRRMGRIPDPGARRPWAQRLLPSRSENGLVPAKFSSSVNDPTLG
jgi:ABC-type transport system involved in multi-copper enzyme maturation permease subunit